MEPRFSRESRSVLLMGTRTLYTIDDDKVVVDNAFSAPWRNDKRCSTLNALVSNSYNGLVLGGFGKSLFLFNPSTCYYVKVLTLDHMQDYRYSVRIGLCYSAHANDYKAVVMLASESCYLYNFVLAAILKTKEWTQISFPFDFRGAREGPVVNGLMHWTVRDSTNDKFSAAQKIIRFDPQTNKFHDFPSPQSTFGDLNAIVGLGVLGGYLCMARADNQTDFKIDGDVEFLTIKEYGVMDSWTTMFVSSNLRVNPSHVNLTPFLITKDGEVLLLLIMRELRNWIKILAYNPKTKSRRCIFEIHLLGTSLYLISFAENLVTPIGHGWDPTRHNKLCRQINWKDFDYIS